MISVAFTISEFVHLFTFLDHLDLCQVTSYLGLSPRQINGPACPFICLQQLFAYVNINLLFDICLANGSTLLSSVLTLTL